MAASSLFQDIFLRPHCLGPEEFHDLLDRVIPCLEGEDAGRRPWNSQGQAGGLLRLQPDLPCLILPDLHARIDFFASVFAYQMTEDLSIAQAMDQEQIQILCLGDGFHAEKRAYNRWQAAFKEFSGGFKKHKAMDQEMRESLGLMEMVMHAKLSWPDRFHFLKGNHENILNENADGNFAFRKFAFEGDMVRDWVSRFYGDDFLYRYASFEKSLPVFAIGGRFLASHAEPARFFEPEEIIECRLRPEVVSGLSWTDNDAAEEDSVAMMLGHYLPEVPDAVYLGGHRTITSHYRLRAAERFVQIHNPELFNAAWLMPNRAFQPAIDIGEIADASPRFTATTAGIKE